MAGRWQREMPERAGHYWTRTGDGEVAGIVEVCALKGGGFFSPAYLRRAADGLEVAPGSAWGGWWWSEAVSPIPDFDPESVKRANDLGASSVEKLSARDRKRVSAGLPPVDVMKLERKARANIVTVERAKPVKAPVEFTVYTVYRQEWIESERGWGVRHDGSTVHLTLDDRNAFVAGYNRTFNNQASAPDCYTRAEGNAKQVSVSEEAYDKLVLHKKQGSDWKRFGVWE